MYRAIVIPSEFVQRTDVFHVFLCLPSAFEVLVGGGRDFDVTQTMPTPPPPSEGQSHLKAPKPWVPQFPTDTSTHLTAV